jgi:tetratricopeptide (TPR) repeat protein
VESARFEKGVLHLRLPQFEAEYDGRMNERGDALFGFCRLNGAVIPLHLEAVTSAPPAKRPLLPALPLPNPQKEITVPSRAGTGGAEPPRPVGQAPIGELVWTYRSGRHEEAVSAASRWGAKRVTLEIGRLLAEDASRENVEEREVTRLAAAAILIESVLSRLRDGDLGVLAPDIRTASQFLEQKPLGLRGRTFAQRYYLLAGLVLQGHVEIADGHRMLAKALQYFPDDPELHTAFGSVVEAVASLRNYDSPPASPEGTRRESRSYSAEGGDYGGVLPDVTLREAETHYEQALAFDPTLDEARLRLARVRLLDGRTEEALRDLERVATESSQPRRRYLALLFTGHARQRLGDLEGAVAAYRSCLAHGPRAQTALLALGRSLDQLGDEAGAQEAFESAGAPDAPFDPWWSYGAGQPGRFDELITELRGLVK